MNDIKKARKICKLSQYELAKSLGINKSNYCNIENGRLIPNNLCDIKNKAIDIILPKLDYEILQKADELKKAINFRKYLVKNINFE